jgi:tetratricopeptide (TPR) repeat protein
LLAPRLQESLDWAMTQIGLGTALYSLGDLEMSTTRLEDAIVAFQDALKVSVRARAPRQWVAAQIGLGNALSWIGGRASRTVRTRERAPLQWAAMQMGFDAFLSGERESGTARLDDAIAIYRNGLKEFAIVLATPDHHETGPAQFGGAVTAYRAALQEMERTRFPVEWATTQNNLGSALQELGERESGTTKLEEAVRAFRDALEEFTEDKAPLDWSMTRNNLDLALRVLGDRGSGTTKLKQAVPASRGALNEQEREALDTLATQTDRGAAPRWPAERERRKREYRLSPSSYQAFRDTRMRRYEPQYLRR